MVYFKIEAVNNALLESRNRTCNDTTCHRLYTKFMLNLSIKGERTVKNSHIILGGILEITYK